MTPRDLAAYAWILVPCPTCGVEARKHCVTAPMVVGFVHGARHDLARRADRSGVS